MSLGGGRGGIGLASAQEFVVGGDGGQGPGVFGQVRDDLVRVSGVSGWQVHDRPAPGLAGAGVWVVEPGNVLGLCRSTSR